ncbi:hypothetical protein Q8F55_007160 [Vanrija albida]|uniref:Uncharacterized protein n=1 Tax=Vanrija albida TaxID=181172 RepID=A0ABR3PZC9_9TREE
MLTPITTPPHSISPEAHAELTSRTPASFADIPPILRWEDDAEVLVDSGSWQWEGAGAANGGGAQRVPGRLFVTEAAVAFLPASGAGFSLPFPQLTLHALTPASADAPAHLYCQIDEGGAVDDEEEEYAPLAEMRVFVPSEKRALGEGEDELTPVEGLFAALSACSALHDSVLPNGEPSSFFGFGDDDDEEDDDDGAFDDAEDGEGGRDADADANAAEPPSPDPIEAFLAKVDWGGVAPPGEWVTVGPVPASAPSSCTACAGKDAEIARLTAELMAERAVVARLQRRLVGLGGLEDKLAAAEL